MRFGYSEQCLDHDTGSRHPENPDRLRAIRRGLQGRHGVEYVGTPPAEFADLRRVHDADYVEEVREFCEDGGGSWDADTVAVEETWDAARQSAGLAIWAAERAVAGDDGRETPFALGRPPGHHAVPDDAMGFCFFNNVAVAAAAVLDSAEEVDCVAIVDWDVHHGNGTQDCFYDRGDVLYASIHEKNLYPGTGDVDEVGESDGEGTTLNVPVPAGSGDVDFGATVDRAFGPAIGRFDPDLVLVSAGFDAHRHDPISRTRVSTEGFGWLADRIRACAEDCDAGLGFVLEGGYGLDCLAESVGTIHEVCHGYRPVEPEGDLESGTETVLERLEDEHPALGD